MTRDQRAKTTQINQWIKKMELEERINRMTVVEYIDILKRHLGTTKIVGRIRKTQ